MDSDTDSDGSVIHVPYVKPQPPVVNLVDSDDDCEGKAKALPGPSKAEKQNKSETASPNYGETVRWELSTTPSGTTAEVSEDRRRKKKRTEKDNSPKEMMAAAEKKRQEKKERRRQQKLQQEENEKQRNSQLSTSPKKKKRKQRSQESLSNAKIPVDPEPVANASSEQSGDAGRNDVTAPSTNILPTKKKSRSKRRGIRRGVQRHKIGAAQAHGMSSRLLNPEGEIGRLVSQGRKTCCNSITKVYTYFCLVPLRQVHRNGNKFDFASLWKRMLHILLVLFYVSGMVYRFGVTVYLMT